jgi:hypothetical protein
MSGTLLIAIVVALLASPAQSAAQTYAPWVTFSITTPDGDTIERTARDSSVATITLKDGTTYELRPTIVDEPFSKVNVAIFKAATATEAAALVGELQLTKGARPVATKTKPSFRIAIPRIDLIGPAKTS